MLKQSTIELIFNTIKVANSIGLNVLIFENNMIRGINEDQTIFVLKELNVPIDIIPLCVTRMSLFSSSYDLVKLAPNPTISTIEDTNYIKQIVLKNSTTSMKIGCGNPSNFKAPRKIPFIHTVSIPIEDNIVSTLIKAASNFGGSDNDVELTLISNDDFVFTITDPSFNSFTYNQKPDTDDLLPKFVFNYNTKLFLSLMKRNTATHIEIDGRQGMAKFIIDGLPIFILPTRQGTSS